METKNFFFAVLRALASLRELLHLFTPSHGRGWDLVYSNR
jgi:hypothetical protein